MVVNITRIMTFLMIANENNDDDDDDNSKHKGPTFWFQVPRQGFQKPCFVDSLCFMVF